MPPILPFKKSLYKKTNHSVQSKQQEIRTQSSAINSACSNPNCYNHARLCQKINSSLLPHHSQPLGIAIWTMQPFRREDPKRLQQLETSPVVEMFHLCFVFLKTDIWNFIRLHSLAQTFTIDAKLTMQTDVWANVERVSDWSCCHPVDCAIAGYKTTPNKKSNTLAILLPIYGGRAVLLGVPHVHGFWNKVTHAVYSLLTHNLCVSLPEISWTPISPETFRQGQLAVFKTKLSSFHRKGFEKTNTCPNIFPIEDSRVIIPATLRQPHRQQQHQNTPLQ